MQVYREKETKEGWRKRGRGGGKNKRRKRGYRKKGRNKEKEGGKRAIFIVSLSQLVITTNSCVNVTHMEWEHTLYVGS